MSNKKTKSALTPKLRFPEFEGAAEWDKKHLNQIAQPVFDTPTEKDEVLTLSGEQGVVLQREYFGKKIAGDNVERYIRVSRNDFIYNDRTTKLSTYGSIKRLSKYESGVVSPIYKCFRFNGKENPVFWEWYFESGFHDAQLRGLVNEGARAGRFNISIDKFLSTFIWSPESPEQQKIADCLTSLDELIAAERAQLDALQAYKKGLLQALFPAEGESLPALRFPEFQSAGEWETNEFSKYIVLYRGSSPRPIQEYFTKNDDGVNWIKIGDTKAADNYVINQVEEKITPEGAEKSRKVSSGELILANSMSFGKTYQLAIDGYIYDGWFVLREYEEYFHKQFLLQLLNSEYMQKQYIRLSAGGIVQNISSDIVYSTILPHTSIEEQQKIAELLTSIDEEIAGQGQRVAALQVHKQGLLQGLFPVPEKT